ncbi:MAG: UTP--glucose-1-phosphate uridylyltransferase, partial [Clostridia bacterium]|nr:UTP--glucose-1-phosphate uridylyltransferase [Clostridia bacterium]
MSVKVTKAIIPAAGLGTRMLPISRAVPKEMLPIVDRPAISYLVDEAVASGITDILIITARGKGAMEDYFDYSPEYEAKLKASGKDAMIAEMRKAANAANITFVRQKETRGLGHAVSCARSFVGDEPFAVLYGDDVIFSQVPAVRQLIDAYERYGLSAAAVKAVPDELVSRYCSLKAEPIPGSERDYHVTDMIEKPRPEQVWTNLAILGRVLLTPDIFDILAETKPGAGGEIQLTDAMRVMAQNVGMTAVDFEGERFDLGSKLGLMCANVKRAVEHAEIG